MKDYADVDAYLAESEQWPDEIRALRPILLASGLVEEIKWGKPCYHTDDGHNVAIVQEFKDKLALLFPKGVLLDDPAGILHDIGPNSRSAQRVHLTSVAEVEQLADTIAAYLRAAIEVADQPIEHDDELELVEELRLRLEADAELAEAFFALTPGRQRHYNLEIGNAKRSATRESRIDKYTPRILEGKGLRDR